MADINSQLPVKLTDGTLTASVRDTGSSDSLNVAVVDGSGNQVTAFGAGTQYTEGDIDASITGTAFLWEDGSDTLRAVSAAKPLPVEVTNASIAVTGTFWQTTQPVSGTVTANAGTNLNTSALALETGGNLATIAGIDFATQTTLAAINTKLTSGTDIGDVTINNAETNPVPVYITSGATSGSEVNNYDTSAAVAASATDNHDYTVTGTTMLLKQVTFAASGKMKVELFVGPVASLVSKGVWFTSTANPSFAITFAQPIEVPVTSTGTVRLARTNLEASAMDVYSTIIGSDI